MERSEKLLFELTPEKFEELSIDLIESQDVVILRKADTSLDLGYDLQGRYNEDGKTKEVAVVVKHKLKLNYSELNQIFKRFFAIWTFHEQFILITSANLTLSHKSIIEKYSSKFNIKIIQQNDIISFLDQNPELKSKYFGTAYKKIRERRIQFVISISAILLSLFGLFISIEDVFSFKKPPINERIVSVGNALKNIKDLEVYLKSIKGDLIETEKQTRLINEKYKKTKELEALSDEQFEAVRSVLVETKKWKERLFDWGIGLLLGISGSLIASLIINKFKQRKAIS